MDSFVYLPHDKYPTVINLNNIEFVRDVGNAIWIHFISGEIHKMHKQDDNFVSVITKLKLQHLLEN